MTNLENFDPSSPAWFLGIALVPMAVGLFFVTTNEWIAGVGVVLSTALLFIGEYFYGWRNPKDAKEVE